MVHELPWHVIDPTDMGIRLSPSRDLWWVFPPPYSLIQREGSIRFLVGCGSQTQQAHLWPTIDRPIPRHHQGTPERPVPRIELRPSYASARERG